MSLDGRQPGATQLACMLMGGIPCLHQRAQGPAAPPANPITNFFPFLSRCEAAEKGLCGCRPGRGGEGATRGGHQLRIV